MMVFAIFRLCQDTPIDVVYTWVNGSDPVFLKNLEEALNKLSDKKQPTQELISRFEDNEVVSN